MKEYIYLEFLWPIKDYFCTLEKNEFVYDWIIPILISCLAYFLCKNDLCYNQVATFSGYIINALAILIGFSITSITILATTDNERTKHLKSIKTRRTIGNEPISLYQLIFITFTFALIVEIILLIINILSSINIGVLQDISTRRLIFAINTILLFHVVFLNIRNITNFYHIFWTKEP